MSALIEFDEVCKYYQMGDTTVKAADHISMKIYVNMDRFGNTSSASVPICLNEMRKNGLLHEGQTIVCTGFGGGLTYGAFVLKL